MVFLILYYLAARSFQRLIHKVLVLLQVLIQLVDLCLLLLQLLRKFLFHLYFSHPPVFSQLALMLGCLFLQIVYFFLQNFNVQLKLLFNFDVVANFGF